MTIIDVGCVPVFSQPHLLVGGVVEVAAVGQRERGELALAVMHGGVVDVPPVAGDEKTAVAVQRQLRQSSRSSPQGEVVGTEAREAHVRFATEHGVEVTRVAAREDGRQRAAGDEQAAREDRADHLAPPQRVAREADHRVDADDVRPVGLETRAQLGERAERAVEDTGLDSSPAKLRRRATRPERREQQLGAASACGSTGTPARLWASASFVPTTWSGSQVVLPGRATR